MSDPVALRISQLNLKPPGPFDKVFKDDCMYCFDTPESPAGLDICLICFNAFSPDDHTIYHYETTSHPVFLNIKKVPKLKQRDEGPKKIVKLAIEADKEEDHFETLTSVKDIEFAQLIDKSSSNLPQIIDSILSATSYARKEEIQAWEQQIVPCEHVLTLKQDQDSVKPDLDKCADCDLHENLWMCLICGNMGCGRAQFGGVGGNGHGVAHFENTGHGVSVKLASITPEGTADVYCYIDNDEVQDPLLAEHLAYWGINIAERQKTEKSLTEMQLEQNLKWDFSMTSTDGQELEPLFGPGLTGMKNLGNSCYLSSVIQCLFSLGPFQSRYYTQYHNPRPSPDPALDLEIQLRKLANGLLSGDYSVPATDTESENPHQKGIAPGMFKALIGKGHEEFSTMRQQDAFEFLIYLNEKISAESKRLDLSDPTDSFKFVTEQRLECLNCHKVRYHPESEENLSIPVPIRRREDAGSDGAVEYETVQLSECLDVFSLPENVQYKCKSCGQSAEAIKSTGFKTFPDTLILNARRFQVVNWVPTKLDIPVEVSDGTVNLDKYLSSGPQAAEDLVQDDDEDEDEQGKITFMADEGSLAVLEEMGFPRTRGEKALYNTGNSDTEAAMNWLFQHMDDPDIDVPLDTGSGNASKAGPSEEQISQLQDMGFTESQARMALKRNNGNAEAAIDWLFSNPDAIDDAEPSNTTQQPDLSFGDSSLPANYALKAIICHKGGSIHAGHYVAFVRKQVDSSPQSQWVLFNDEKVVKGGEIEEMKRFAYIYLFERIK